MDDERLELSDAEHPDAKEAAVLAARLLLHLHEKRHEEAKENAPKPDEKQEGDDGK